MDDRVLHKTPAAQGRDDLLAMFRQMAPVLGVLSVTYIIATMCWFIAPAVVPTWIGRYTLRLVMFIGIAIATAPFYVALHRFVAYREVRWLPPLRILDGEARIYAAYAGFSMGLYFLPFIAREWFTALGLVGIDGLVFLAMVAVSWIALVRITTLLPMAALDPEGASWRRALQHTKGRGWSYFVAMNVPTAPALIVLLLIAGAVARGNMPSLVFYPLAILGLLAWQLLPLAIATRLYLERVRDDTNVSAALASAGSRRR